jgi:23S rRNA (cytidine1920-2'-O)/16S rRNA (cytidine1409-2'-O)-methyltransferase
MARGERLDLDLVRRGLVDSRARAQALIGAGEVLVDEVVWDKPGARVLPEQAVRVRTAAIPYVSRGGLKLEAALDFFGVDPTGRVCADLGASTGGFTDCLLQRGAARVYAVDVGYGQLAWKLRQDPRVVVMERTNVRHLEGLPEPIGLVVGDLSFISLSLVLPAIRRLDPRELVLLVKPQFEVGREAIGKGGVVRDADAREEAVRRVCEEAESAGFVVVGRMESPVPGAKAGNREWLVHLRAPVVESGA